MSSEFLKMVADWNERNFAQTFQRLVADKVPCGIFFGFELVPNEAKNFLQMFVNARYNVTCAIVLADRQADVLKKFTDVPVVALEDLEHLGEENFPVKPQEVFILEDGQNISFAPCFFRNGINVLSPVGWSMNPNFFPFMMKHLPELFAVHEMLADDESKKVFRAAITGRITGRISDYRYATEAQYFLDGFTPTAGDIAIDGGAYDGSTATDFVRQGAKVFAFEMDADNYRKCIAPAEKFGFTIENLGLSDRESDGFYFPNDTGSCKVSIKRGGITCSLC